MKTRIGYACLNTYLRKRGVFCSRTAREATIKERGIKYASELFHRNLEDMLRVLQWNEDHGIRLFRMSSEMVPHMSNPTFIAKKHRGNPRKLAYNFAPHMKLMRQIGEFARKHGHRLTFHPGQFVVVGAQSDDVFIRSSRELYMHARIMDIMGLDLNSIIIIHGGGVYCDKMGTMTRWSQNFARLPFEVKRRLVLENDETCYSTVDVLQLSRMLPAFPGCGRTYRIPIIFDIFHYHCYDLTIARKNRDIEKCRERDAECDSPNMRSQPPIRDLLPAIIASWGRRCVKMHLSEQGRSKVVGKHSYLVKSIPSWAVGFGRTYGRPLDIMIEAKGKERAVIALKKKYGSRIQ